MATSGTLDRKFGMLAIKKGYASKEQVNQAIQEQRCQAAQGKAAFIGDILVQAEIITHEQKNEILGTQKEPEKQIDEKKEPLQAVEKNGEGTEEKGTLSDDMEEKLPDLEGAKRVQNDSGFELAITKDRTQAYIYPQGENGPEIGVDVIKGLIETERIIYGNVDDKKLAGYLASTPTKDCVFRIAQGKPSEPGKATEIKYHFDTNPFKVKVAAIDKSGKIDYKNRGKIPMVKAGDILAEIIPGTEGQPGKDVYGGVLEPPRPDLVTLSCGVGVNKGEDGLKAFAKIDGRPEVLKDNTICVTDTLTIADDIGVETGNIEFEGNIVVKGAVQEGYRVKGKTLRADEINSAEIEMQGDIVVAKGIIGSKILTDGTVKAKHIYDSTIDALGDIIVEREVYESRIETNGVFRIERGAIMGSTLSAMKGLEATDIGSEASDPCTIITGIDNRLEKQITIIKIKISEKEKEQERLKSLLDEIKDKPQKLEEEVGQLAQKQDQAMVKGRTLKQTLKSLQKADDRKNIIKVLTLIKGLNSKLEQMQKDLDNLLKEQERTEANVTTYKNEIKKLGEEIEELDDDIKSLLEMSKIRQASSGVKATGVIYDRTSIKGRNASLIVKGSLQRVLVQEIKNPDPNSDQAWLMSVSLI